MFKTKSLTEKEMREMKTPKIDSARKLAKFINKLIKQDHDYGTCVYAMSIGAEAAFRFVAGKLVVTGFQASCADLDFIKRIRHLTVFRITDYEQMLYPQYAEEFDKTITSTTFDWLRGEAIKKLSDPNCGSPECRAHWQSIINGEIPFGYTIG